MPDGGLAAEHVTVGAAAGGALKEKTLQADICCSVNVDETLELGDRHVEIFILSSNSISHFCFFCVFMIQLNR